MSHEAALTRLVAAPVVTSWTFRSIVLVCGTEPRAPCRVLVTLERIIRSPPSFQNFWGTMDTTAWPVRPFLSVQVPV